MCAGECYNPSSERYLIDRIEIIKISPQEYQGEPIEPLIQDNWKVIDCPKTSLGCVVEFEDPNILETAHTMLEQFKRVPLRLMERI